jgi:hypothetical protein
MRYVMCVLCILLVVVVPVAGQKVQVSPDKKYYVQGETFRITVGWNGTDQRYVISLGPHLRVIGAEYREEQRIVVRPVNAVNVSGWVTAKDPNQTWIVQVEMWNGSSIFTPSYYDVGLVDMRTAQLLTKIHREIVIVDMNMLLQDYNSVKIALQDEKNKEINYQNEINYLHGQLSQAQRGEQIYRLIAEYSRVFNKYFDYVKFVNKSLSEYVPFAQVQMTITLPMWYDPAEEKWVTVSASDVKIEGGVLWVRVPWRAVYCKNETACGNETWVPVDSLMDPNNHFNQVMWNLWFYDRSNEATQKYKQLYTNSWVVPFGVVGAIIVFFALITLFIFGILRKWERDRRSRPVVPPI